LRVPLRGCEAEGCQRSFAQQGGGARVRDMPIWLYPRAASEWLTRILAGSPGVSIDGDERPGKQEERFHLVRWDETAGYSRRVMDNVGGDNARPEDVVAFPDLYPLLVTTRESLEEVNRRVPDLEVGMERFRPNIVVTGSPEAFDEDKWAVVEVGENGRVLTLRCLESDPRCQVPSIDQQTGEKHPQLEPSRTLRGFRRVFDPFGKAGVLARAGPMFGVYAAHGGQPGEVHVGDAVRVVERSDAGSLHEYWSRRGAK